LATFPPILFAAIAVGWVYLTIKTNIYAPFWIINVARFGQHWPSGASLVWSPIAACTRLLEQLGDLPEDDFLLAQGAYVRLS
jgi:hypothetical protein